jgi:uncharacterized protein YndB with AHSA1/START domain
MKILKRSLLVLISLVALVLITALFVDGKFSATKKITINQPKEVVFAYIKQLKNQDNYSAWGKMDPKMKKTYKGTDGTIGFVSAWESKDDNVGAGEQEIIKIDENKRIDYELRFKKPFESVSPAFMTTKAVSPTVTEVQWGFKGEMVYPLNIMQLFLDMDAMIGDDFEKGLTNLKGILEK